MPILNSQLDQDGHATVDLVILPAAPRRKALQAAGQVVPPPQFAPGMIDQYLARTNYEAQQTDEPVEANRRDNLWSPVPGDHGAHGSFDARRIISARKHG